MSEISKNKIYYWLSLSGIGSKKLNAALNYYSAEEIYFNLPNNKELQDFFGEKNTDILLNSRNITFIDKKLDVLFSLGIKLLTLNDEQYPLSLKQYEVSPPICIYYMGNIKLINSSCIAIVGTRNISSYGKEVTKYFAKEFSEAGVTVVSGLATGVDSYAHEYSLPNTIAVLGGGHKHIASFSVNLAKKILDGGGLIISEYPPYLCPTKYTFPERNRIISGLSKAVVVIEAGQKSGALITADFALEQGREVYAVPGSIFSSKSEGCNNLIKNGQAAIALSPQDILSELRINSGQKRKKSHYISLDFNEQKIYTLLLEGKMHYDELIEASSLAAGELTNILLSLELKGLVQRLPSNYYIINGEKTF